MSEVSAKTLDEIDEFKEKEDLKKLEAVFFVSGRFLKMNELVSLTDLNPILIRELIEKLQEKYDKKDSSIEIVEKNGLWKMDLRREFSYLVNKLATGSAEFSKAEQETLAIIAYKQPIKQSVIIKIRGNKAYDHVKKFVGLGLIKKKKMGHTSELNLGDSFYDYFNVKEKEDGSSGFEVDEDAPGYKNDQLDKEIEEAEKEVQKDEVQGKFEDEQEEKYNNPTGYGEGVEVVAEAGEDNTPQ
jgi:segregation and condensation protein B